MWCLEAHPLLKRDGTSGGSMKMWMRLFVLIVAATKVVSWSLKKRCSLSFPPLDKNYNQTH